LGLSLLENHEFQKLMKWWDHWQCCKKWTLDVGFFMLSYQTNLLLFWLLQLLKLFHQSNKYQASLLLSIHIDGQSYLFLYVKSFISPTAELMLYTSVYTILWMHRGASNLYSEQHNQISSSIGNPTYFQWCFYNCPFLFRSII